MGDARNLVNWNYARCPLDTAVGHFGPFRDIVQLWRDRMGSDGRLARRRDFDFYDFEGWWGRVSIAKIEHDPFDVRFVLWGTQLSEWWGVDYTNKRLGEASITPDVWLEVEGDYFREMDKVPFIGLVSGCLDQHGRPDIKVLGVDLPLAPEEGETVGHVAYVLSVHIQVGQDETIDSTFPGISGLKHL